MQLTRALYKNSVLFFAGFAVLVIWGFWETYYSNPLQFSDVIVHLHGLVMTGWCGMIVAQAFFIRSDRRYLHRLVGKASYIFAPIVFLSLVVVSIRLMRRSEGLIVDGQFIDIVYYGQSLTTLGAVVFGVLYLLAVLNRHNPAVHGRLMVCTVFPIAAAALDRVLGNYFPELVAQLPVIAGSPSSQLVTWILADQMLLGLAVWDWVSHRRANVYPAVLLLLVAYHVFTANAHHIGPWRSFVDWAGSV